MSDCEQDTTSQEDYVSEVSSENELPQSEEEDEYNMYDNAIERYAELIGHIPEDKLNGIVETVEKIFEHRFEEHNNNDDIICGVLLSGAVILIAAVAKMYLF